MNKQVVISNSSLNSYGFRVMTEGIDIEQYKRNPILLWMHQRPVYGDKNQVLPLGRMEDIHIEGDTLIGTPVFDENDEFAKQIKSKWDAGIIKMVSAGLEVIERSSDTAVLLPGQRFETVTKSKLVEVSIVDIGANDDAIALGIGGEMVRLSAGTLQDNGILKPINNNLKINQMKQIALKLGLAENATEQEVLCKVEALQGEAAQAVQLRKEKEEETKRAIVSEVDEAVRLGKITADKKQMFIEMGEKIGCAQLKDTFALMSGPKRPSDIINQNGKTAYTKLSEVPAEQRAALRENDYDTYASLYKAEYGIEL